MTDWFMDRYRGTSGLFGWIVLKLDVLWLRGMVRIAKRVNDGTL